MFQTLSCDFFLEEGKTYKIHVKKKLPSQICPQMCVPFPYMRQNLHSSRCWRRRVANTRRGGGAVCPPTWRPLSLHVLASSSPSRESPPATAPPLPFAPLPQAPLLVLVLASLQVSAKRRHRSSSTNWRSPPRPTSSSGDRRTGGLEPAERRPPPSAGKRHARPLLPPSEAPPRGPGPPGRCAWMCAPSARRNAAPLRNMLACCFSLNFARFLSLDAAWGFAAELVNQQS